MTETQELERPYIVCDACARTWTAQTEEPTRCKYCGHSALWAFPTLDAAELLSDQIVERRDGQ